MTGHDALCFLLMGLLGPAVVFGFLGAPWLLVGWAVAAILLSIFKPRRHS
jgi:hypothetical protein